MKLTAFAKFFITVVILGVIGYAVWHYKGADIAIGLREHGTPESAQDRWRVTSDYSVLSARAALPSGQGRGRRPAALPAGSGAGRSWCP